MSIVTDGLIGYWHYKQGVSGNAWNNIAPATKGQYNGNINGAVLQSSGMYFDGIDDCVTTTAFPTTSEFTLEVFMEYVDDFKSQVPVSYFLSTNIRGSVQINTDNFVQWSDNGGTYRAPTLRGSIQKNTIVYISVRVKGATTNIFLNGILVSSANYSSQSFGGSIHIGRRLFNSNSFDWFKGTIISTRLYNRYLSSEEIAQNYSTGTAIGLDDPTPVNTPPSVTIVSQSRIKLSNIPPMDKSTLKFKFDQDVTDWAVMVLGSDYSTGTIAGSGKSIVKDTEISVSIAHQMLYQEGDNRINIYGRNKDGLWTPYD